jgi:hypothetical protein
MSDLIKREDAIQALINTEEIKGNAYVVLLRALEEIPAVKEVSKDEQHTER